MGKRGGISFNLFGAPVPGNGNKVMPYFIELDTDAHA